ncbi:DUF4139 domain-containing protein [Streptacidiphilus sp. EB129]|uniref:DUF4139 domain-containing protein n=1 Tax=Streptacidiphilus sp. EB129 TaxID=3156262 RepID=UPI00351336EE
MPAPLTTSSVLHSVVVYASGALCTRRARVRLGARPDRRIRLRLDGLPLTMDARSLRARIDGGPAGSRVVDVRREVAADISEPADLAPLQRALDAAEEAADAARAVQSALAEQVERVAGVRAVPPPTRRGDPHRLAPAEALLTLAEFVDSRLDALHGRLISAGDARTEADQRVEIARRRLREASGALPTQTVRTTSSVLVTLDLGAEHLTGPEPSPGPQPLPGPEPSPEAGSAAEPGVELELELEYGVPGATWAPVYDLRLTGIHGDAPGATLAMRAVIAQRTGEDWRGVRLGLSTADLRRRTDAPELRSLRIGRRQAEQPAPAHREPPSGLPELFAGYDAFLGAQPVPRTVAAARAHQEWQLLGGAPEVAGASASADIEASADAGAGTVRSAGVARRASRAAGPGSAQPVPSAPQPAAYASAPVPSGYGAAPGAPGAAPFAVGGAARGVARGAVAEDMVPQALMAAAPPPSGPPPRQFQQLAEPPRDFNDLAVTGADGTRGERGRLLPASAGLDAVTVEYVRRAESVAGLALPEHCSPVRFSAGSFDYRYDTAAPVDVPADGGWHTVPVQAFPVTLAPEHVCVPSADPRVYAAVRVGNTSGHALLAGPAEVSLDGDYLMTTQLPTLAPGQSRRVGIGVVEGIQVARNTQMRETTAGLRNGTLVLEHRVEVELANRLGHPVTVEVRERVPVSDDKDARVDEQAATPPWTAVPPEQDVTHRRGMRVWLVTLEPRATTRLSGGFDIRIPAAKALSDGNRRH